VRAAQLRARPTQRATPSPAQSPRARVSQPPAQLAARPTQHARARAPAQLPASSPGGRCSPARRRLCAHDRGQPHDQARVARTQRVGSSAPPPAQPGPARQRARPRPLFIFQNRTACIRGAQFLAHAPRLDLAPRLASAVARARARSAPRCLAASRVAEVSPPRPLSPSPFFLPRRTRLLRPCSPSSRCSSSPARPRPAAVQLRSQQALRVAISLPSRIAARSKPVPRRADPARPRPAPSRNRVDVAAASPRR
jgi:hypothetical protein